MGPVTQDRVCSPKGQGPGEGSLGHSLANLPFSRLSWAFSRPTALNQQLNECSLNCLHLLLLSVAQHPSPVTSPDWGPVFSRFPVSVLLTSYTHSQGNEFLIYRLTLESLALRARKHWVLNSLF